MKKLCCWVGEDHKIYQFGTMIGNNFYGCFKVAKKSKTGKTFRFIERKFNKLYDAIRYCKDEKN